MVNPEELISAAIEARKRAYAPYSGYRVGAALLDEQGRVFRGSNVENVCYPAGLCAERVAVGTLVSAGGKEIKAVAVATVDGGMPCGICLQTLCEFADPPTTSVHVVDQMENRREYLLSELMPHGFSSKVVKRENDSTR